MMTLLKDLLEASAADSEPYQYLVGKTIAFKDEKLGLEKDFKIKKITVNKAFANGHSINLSLFLDGLNQTKNVRQESKTNHKASELNMALLRGHFHGEKMTPAQTKEYFEKYFHPYGDKGIIDSLNDILEGKKAVWSENGLQGKNYINVDIG
jgi:hypothetical protein